MSYVKNLEAPPQRFLSIPFVVLLTVAMAVVAFTVGMPWWGWALTLGAALVGAPILVHKEYEPIRTAEREYHDYLKTCSLREMAQVVNDPNRPERTKALVRYHLNESHPGWHEQIDIAQPIKC